MDELERYDQECEDLWYMLSPAAQAVLKQLCKNGPTHDGNIASKSGRDELIQKKLAAKIVMAGMIDGFQAATYRGAHSYRVAVLKPRKEAVAKLVGRENVSGKAF